MPDRSNVSQLLEKTEHYDKDERYMATSDLCECLKQKRGTWGTHTERQICTAVLRLLHDKSHDVQAIAVKTLSVLLTTVQEEQVLEIADSLTNQVLDSSKTELRDVYAIGLRTLCKTIPSSMGPAVGNRLVVRLLNEVSEGKCGTEISLVCLDVLTDILTRFGGTAPSVLRQHEALLNMCLKLLGGGNSDSTDPVLHKKAGNTLATLAVVLSDSLLSRMIESLLKMVNEDAKGLLRTTCTVAGAVAHRLGMEHMDQILPLLLQFLPPTSGGDGDDDDMLSQSNSQDEATMARENELRESCFMGFESFLQKCPTLVDPNLEAIVQAALSYMCYDPNYSYSDNDVNMQQDDDDDEYDDEYGEDEEDDEYDDDDEDESWKVRRSAIRTIRAVIGAKQHTPDVLWTSTYDVNGKSIKIPQALLDRFKEREENCRVGIIDCFTDLLSVTTKAFGSGIVQNSMTSDEMENNIEAISVPLVKSCETILNSKSNERSKSSVLALLSELCQIPGGMGAENLSTVFKHVQVFLSSQKSDTSLQGTSKAIRLDALSLIHILLASPNHDHALVRKCLLDSLLPELCSTVQEQWYKVVAEALRAMSYVPGIMIDATESDRSRVANDLFDAMEPLLASHDVDQEIKECALNATASLLSHLHPNLNKEQQSRLLELILERLKNEVTRLSAIKTLLSIASKENSVDLSPILSDCLDTLASFLKLQSRSAKQSALQALEVLLKFHGQRDDALYPSILTDLAPLISDSDLHLTHLSLSLAKSIVALCSNSEKVVKDHVLDRALALCTSPLLQDAALESLIAFLQQIVTSKAVEERVLLDSLGQKLTDSTSKHGIYNLSMCIAATIACTDAAQVQSILSDLVSNLSDSKNTNRTQLNLLVTGYIGRRVDLGQYSDISTKLKNIYVAYFDSESEDIKQAAACALGNSAAGSQAMFLPTILEQLGKEDAKQKYLLLSSLKEFVKSSAIVGGKDSITENLPIVVEALEKHFSDTEESVRTMVAECMGSLAVLQPEIILQKLVELQNNHRSITVTSGLVDESDAVSKKNAVVCWTVATSIKLAVSGKIDPTELSKYLPTFIELITCEEIHVLNASLLMVYSIVHHMSQIIAPLFQSSVTPTLYKVSNLELKRVVDLGPFKHTVDDALPLRKAALSIFATSLDNLPGVVDISAFMPVLASAMEDAEDIQLHAHQIIISMCTKHPSHLVNSIDNFVEPLGKTIRKKTADKSGTELDRLQDWIKSAVRVTMTLSRLDGSSTSTKFIDFVEKVKAEGRLALILEAVMAEM